MSSLSRHPQTALNNNPGGESSHRGVICMKNCLFMNLEDLSTPPRYAQDDIRIRCSNLKNAIRLNE